MADPREEPKPAPENPEEEERPADAGEPGDWGNAGRWGVFANRPNIHRAEIEKENRE